MAMAAASSSTAVTGAGRWLQTRLPHQYACTNSKRKTPQCYRLRWRSTNCARFQASNNFRPPQPLAHIQTAAHIHMTSPNLRLGSRRVFHTIQPPSRSFTSSAAAALIQPNTRITLWPSPTAAASIPHAAPLGAGTVNGTLSSLARSPSSLNGASCISTNVQLQTTHPPFHFDRLVHTPECWSAFQHAFRHQSSLFHSPAPIPPSQRTVVVAVSGGVDSAMTAQLVHESGIYGRVVGVHMRNWDEIEESGHCSGERDMKDAAAICQALRIPFEVVDYSREYFNDVFQELLAAYSKGETPSPDVLCNRVIKFDLLLQHVKQKYGPYAILATGHYARIKHLPDTPLAATTSSTASALPSDSTSFAPQLFVALDPRKDQSYFLSSVCATALRSCMFPLGFCEKKFLKQVAASSQSKPALATLLNAAPTPSTSVASSSTPTNASATLSKSPSLPSSGLQPSSCSVVPSVPSSPFAHVSGKRESMGICFIGKRPMQEFLSEYITLHPGDYIDIDTGDVVGRHGGWEVMTIGQGAAIHSQKHKYYVCGKTSHQVAGLLVDQKLPPPPPSRASRRHPKLRHRSGYEAQAEAASAASMTPPPPPMKVPLPSPPYCIYVCATRQHPALYADELYLDELRWIDRNDSVVATSITSSSTAAPNINPMSIRVKFRSTGSTMEATLYPLTPTEPSLSTSNSTSTPTPSYRVHFTSPQFAIALGQTCVVYDASGVRCLGEGRISLVGKSYAQLNKPIPMQGKHEIPQQH